MNVLDFQRVWGDPPAHLTERAAAQSHFNDLCALFGQPKPTDDPDADYTFERGVRKLGGGQGFADVWKRGAFAWEYKRPGGDLDAAYGVISRAGFLCPPLRRNVSQANRLSREFTSAPASHARPG